VSNLEGSAAYIFSGIGDPITPPNLQEALELIYLELGLDSNKVELEYDAEVGHGIKPYLPAEIIEWLAINRFDVELNEQVGDPNEYGRTHQFSQEKVADHIGATLQETQMEA